MRLRRARQHVPARRASRRVNQMTALEQHHDLTEVLQWHLLILGDLFHLHGAPELVIVDQLGESNNP